MTLKVLILGGTSEGRELAERLAADPRFAALLSFAGRTESLQRPSVPHRVGGFGGATGLCEYLQREQFAALVDATHPFAAQMSRHAVQAAERTCTPLIRLERPAWRAEPGDDWQLVPDMPSAAHALGEAPRRVFLSIGRQELQPFRAAPQHEYLVRAVDPFDPGLPRARVLASRGPFALHDELELLQRERIQVIVSKNSGTSATYPKLAAARTLGLPVVMVQRPALPEARLAHSLEEIASFLHGLSRTPRGV